MNWEDKFSAIVKETESNLARVKQRLTTSRNGQYNSSTGSPYGDIQMNSSLPMCGNIWTSNSGPLNSASLNRPLKMHYSQAGQYSESTAGTGQFDNLFQDMKTSALVSCDPTIDQSPGVSLLLSERIDMQNKTIENLIGLMSRLEMERDHQLKQMKELKDDMSALSTRVVERGVDLQTEKKVNQWKQNVMSEMQILKTQVSLSRNRDNDEHGYSNSQLSQLLKDMHSIKLSIREEFNEMKQDIGSINNRLSKLEGDVQRLGSNSRENSFKQEQIDQSIRKMQEQQKYERSCGQYGHKEDLGDLKGSLRLLENKLQSVEALVYDKGQIPLTKKLKNDKKKTYVDFTSPYSSDIDLSDFNDEKELSLTDNFHSSELLSDVDTGELQLSAAVKDDDNNSDLDLEGFGPSLSLEEL